MAGFLGLLVAGFLGVCCCTLKHTIYIYLDLLTSNGLIPQSTYYDFNDSIPIVIISVWK